MFKSSINPAVCVGDTDNMSDFDEEAVLQSVRRPKGKNPPKEQDLDRLTIHKRQSMDPRRQSSF